MKISEIIKYLVKLQKLHGDLPVTAGEKARHVNYLHFYDAGDGYADINLELGAKSDG